VEKQLGFGEVLTELRRRVLEIANNSCSFGRIVSEFSQGQAVTVEISTATYRMPELERLAQRSESRVVDPVAVQIDDLRPYLRWLAAHLNPPLIAGILEIVIAHGAMASVDVDYGSGFGRWKKAS